MFKRTKRAFGNWAHKSMGGNILKPGMEFINSSLTEMINIKINREPPVDFDAYCRIHNLDAEKLAKIQNRYAKQAMLFTVCGMVLFIYAIYQVNAIEFLHMMNYLIAVTIFFLLAARANYFNYLIKERTLGVNFKSWLLAIIKGEI